MQSRPVSDARSVSHSSQARNMVSGLEDKYLGANGGSNNAFTASEDTCYFFDVDASALPGALARFADFFCAPLFKSADNNVHRLEHARSTHTSG